MVMVVIVVVTVVESVDDNILRKECSGNYNFNNLSNKCVNIH